MKLAAVYANARIPSQRSDFAERQCIVHYAALIFWYVRTRLPIKASDGASSSPRGTTHVVSAATFREPLLRVARGQVKEYINFNGDRRRLLNTLRGQFWAGS